MPRALADIITELNSVYDPQRQSYNQQIGTLDPQQAAEQKGLEATKNDAFGQITDQANRRGLFYSGIPIAEEQKYTGATFLPSVANLHAKYTQQKFNLQDAIAKITADQYNQAYGVRQGEADLEEKQRQFNEQLAATRAASSGGGGGGGGGGYFPTGGGGAPSSQNAPAKAAVNVNPADQMLYNQMFVRGDGQKWSDQDLVRDYNATLNSARRGNQRDIQKINFYHTFRSDLFGGTPPNVSAGAGGGGGGVVMQKFDPKSVGIPEFRTLNGR